MEGVILIGSQVRGGSDADQWSDLDVMLLLNDFRLFLKDNTWVQRFGSVVCAFNYITPLHFVKWDWCVKRVLYDDNRSVDFCVLPYDQVDDVLAINGAILAKGYDVVYDSHPPLLESKIKALLQTVQEETPAIPTEEDLDNAVNDCLFHIIWAFKKIKRKELWVAVNDINEHINNLLLRLIEYHNAAVTQKSTSLMYEGRFLEVRTAGEILDQLRNCFARYDEADAIDTLGHLIDLLAYISKDLYGAYGYRFNAGRFETIRKLYGDMKLQAGGPAGMKLC